MEIVRIDAQWRVFRRKCKLHDSLETIALAQGYRVGSVCTQLKVSEPYFREVFLRDVGLTPKEWMRQERMVVARRLLLHECAAETVSLRIGFASLNSFRREFREIYGVTVSEFPVVRIAYGIWE